MFTALCVCEDVQQVCVRCSVCVCVRTHAAGFVFSVLEEYWGQQVCVLCSGVSCCSPVEADVTVGGP